MTDAHAKAVEAAEGWYQYQISSSREDAWYFANGIITAYLAAMRAEGWVMVPVEPTDEMMEAGLVEWSCLRSMYQAMIEAAMLKGAGDEQG